MNLPLILNLFKSYIQVQINGETSTREYSSHFNIGYKTAQRHLFRMKELSLISDNGEDSNSPNYKYVSVSDEELGH